MRLLSILSILILSANAAAEPKTDAARLELEAAHAAEATGNWRGAIVRYERAATTLRVSSATRFHLARCHAELGELVEALREQEQGLDLLAREPASSSTRVAAETDRAKYDARAPSVVLRLDGDASDPRIFVDQKPVAPSSAVRLNPGRHELLVMVAGYRPWSTSVELAEGQRIEQTVALERDIPPIPAPIKLVTHPDHASGNTARTIVLVAEAALVVAGAAVVVQSRFAASSAGDTIADKQARLTSNSDCGAATPSTAADCAELARAIDDRDAANHRTVAGVALLVGGGVTAIATIALWPSASSAHVPQARLELRGSAIVLRQWF